MGRNMGGDHCLITLLSIGLLARRLPRVIARLKSGLVDKIGNAVGVNDLVNKFMNGRGMRRGSRSGTLEERARGKGPQQQLAMCMLIPMPVEGASGDQQLKLLLTNSAHKWGLMDYSINSPQLARDAEK